MGLLLIICCAEPCEIAKCVPSRWLCVRVVQYKDTWNLNEPETKRALHKLVRFGGKMAIAVQVWVSLPWLAGLRWQYGDYVGNGTNDMHRIERIESNRRANRSAVFVVVVVVVGAPPHPPC